MKNSITSTLTLPSYLDKYNLVKLTDLIVPSISFPDNIICYGFNYPFNISNPYYAPILFDNNYIQIAKVVLLNHKKKFIFFYRKQTIPINNQDKVLSYMDNLVTEINKAIAKYKQSIYMNKLDSIKSDFL